VHASLSFSSRQLEKVLKNKNENISTTKTEVNSIQPMPNAALSAMI
jgi:hypothetical protein